MTASPQEFDFDAWLADADRPERAVTVYQKSSLVADLELLAERITLAEADEEADGPSMGGGAGKLRAEYAALAQKFHDSALVVRVQSLTRDEQREIGKENEGLDADELGAITISKAIVSPKVSPAQVKQLARVIGDAQMGLLMKAYYAACEAVPSVSADFLPKPSTQGDGGE